MIICTAILWVGSTIVSPVLGEIKFDQFRQQKIIEINRHLKSINEDPMDAIEYFNLGIAYMAMGRHRQEINSYLEAIRLNSNYAKAYFNLAIAYDNAGNGKEAINHARRAETLYSEQRKHRQVRKVRRKLNILNEKYK
jgi:tetratricopeptide (TPR) repeat protein